MHGNGVRHVNCLGVGVGPANLSLASLLHGHPEVGNVFMDRRTAFGWHDGQQLPDARLQVSMLKDLVSLADPTNPFSFLSYLHDRGRIYHFINAQFDAVPRQEFRDYLKWASERNPNVVHGEEVRSIEFDGVFVVRTDQRTVTADNISVGVGLGPAVPAFARPFLGATQFHISDFVDRAVDLAGKRVCVVGGGQSGAEAFLDLINREPRDAPRRISWITRRRNYLPIDDSPFTNDFYMPDHSDYFAGLDPAARARFTTEQALSSDGISESTLRDIYQRVYVRRFVEGRHDQIALFPHREVFDVQPGARDGWSLRMRHRDHPGVPGQLDVDVVVWATGFSPATMSFLDPIAHRIDREGDEFRIDDQFAVRWDGPPGRDIFLHNAAMRQRGLPDRNLSLIAWRSRRIVDRLRGVRGDEQRPSFMEWAPKTGPVDDAVVVG
ncbi:lysine N(6)-hydroxylase/L-ornithine N(5)-oxygenase family protein [Actinosynnema sp. CS-041913]|uniref:lysine N(6)-hydroxylase/L-ornithine N(5)-oxygenase family protein n=1 Tax=Actinosynnema sp. CS-041913 TaxID=3239917 RepID=UPI003D8F7607